MTLARALPAVALLAAIAIAAAAPAQPRAKSPAPPSSTATDAPDSFDKTSSPPIDEQSLIDSIRYPEGSLGPEQPGWGTGSGRIFSQLVAPVVQLVVNQLLQATNLVGTLAGYGRPNAVLQLFSGSIGRLSGGGTFPGVAPAPPIF